MKTVHINFTALILIIAILLSAAGKKDQPTRGKDTSPQTAASNRVAAQLHRIGD